MVHGFLRHDADAGLRAVSDRLGRKAGDADRHWRLLALAAVALFLMMVAFKTPLALLGGTAVMAAAEALGSSAMLVSVSESLPAHLRSGGIGIIYALAISIFGGTAQFIVTCADPGDRLAAGAGLYMTAALVLGLCAMLMVRETAPVRAGR